MIASNPRVVELQGSSKLCCAISSTGNCSICRGVLYSWFYNTLETDKTWIASNLGHCAPFIHSDESTIQASSEPSLGTLHGPSARPEFSLFNSSTIYQVPELDMLRVPRDGLQNPRPKEVLTAVSNRVPDVPCTTD